MRSVGARSWASRSACRHSLCECSQADGRNAPGAVHLFVLRRIDTTSSAVYIVSDCAPLLRRSACCEQQVRGTACSGRLPCRAAGLGAPSAAHAFHLARSGWVTSGALSTNAKVYSPGRRCSGRLREESGDDLRTMMLCVSLVLCGTSLAQVCAVLPSMCFELTLGRVWHFHVRLMPLRCGALA